MEAEYIERQAVIDETDEEIQEFPECEYALKFAKRWIKKIPAADVRPVVRGQWKPFDLTYGRSIYACSSCGESSEVPTVLGKLRYQYCPNCGDEMIGDDEDG